MTTSDDDVPDIEGVELPAELLAQFADADLGDARDRSFRLLVAARLGDRDAVDRIVATTDTGMLVDGLARLTWGVLDSLRDVLGVEPVAQLLQVVRDDAALRRHCATCHCDSADPEDITASDAAACAVLVDAARALDAVGESNGWREDVDVLTRDQEPAAVVRAGARLVLSLAMLVHSHLPRAAQQQMPVGEVLKFAGESAARWYGA